MNYIENIYVCLAAPFIIATLCLGKSHRRIMELILGGMTSCLLSSYISTFFAVAQHTDFIMASISITPIVEELMKFLPVLFYLVVFEPEREKAVGAMLLISIGFATFENVCYLTQNGAGSLSFLLIRGFGAGTMHIVCGMIIAIGLMYLWDKYWIRTVGLISMLGLTITYHSIYNMIVSQSGIIAIIGYMIPVLTVSILLIFRRDVIRIS